ncbi:hypothetical protein ACKKBG_A14140 [Auxenochlorella protothecoides x Auxenochlorella symbiontica]
MVSYAEDGTPISLPGQEFCRISWLCKKRFPRELPHNDAVIAAKGGGARLDVDGSAAHDGTLNFHPHPEWELSDSDSDDEGFYTPVRQLDKVKVDPEMEARIWARLMENINQPIVWLDYSDKFKQAIIADFMRDKNWKERAARKLLREDMQASGKVPLHSSPLPTANLSPVSSARSDPSSEFTSEADDIDEHPRHQLACSPGLTSGSLRSWKSSSVQNQVCSGWSRSH